MNVYLVYFREVLYEYEEPEVIVENLGVFSTMELANKFINNYEYESHGELHIQTLELDNI